MPAARSGPINPRNQTRFACADAAAFVLESAARRKIITFLLDHPDSTRSDI
jgi:hypothetical protein